MGKVYGSIYFVEDLKDETIKDIKDDPCCEFVICLDPNSSYEELRNITVLNDAGINVLKGGKVPIIPVYKLEEVIKELSENEHPEVSSMMGIMDTISIIKGCDESWSFKDDPDYIAPATSNIKDLNIIKGE